MRKNELLDLEFRHLNQMKDYPEQGRNKEQYGMLRPAQSTVVLPLTAQDQNSQVMVQRMISGDFQPTVAPMNPDVNNFTMNPSRNQVDRFYSHNIQNMSMQFLNDQGHQLKNHLHHSPITPRDQFYGLGPLKDANDAQLQMLVTPPPLKTPGSQHHALNTDTQHQPPHRHSLYHSSQLNGQDTLQSIGSPSQQALVSQSEQTVEAQPSDPPPDRSADPSITSTVRHSNQQEIVEDTRTENMTEAADTARHHHLPLLDRELTHAEVRNCEQACEAYVRDDEFEIEL